MCDFNALINKIIYDNIKWKPLWGGSVVITNIIGLIIYVFLPNSIINLVYEGFSHIIGVFLLISFITSYKSIPGGYSLSKQAVCHMGRIYTKKGTKNTTGAFFFAVFATGEALLHIFLGNLIWIYSLSGLWWMTIGCYLTATFWILTGYIPIDINEKYHLKAALYLIFAWNFTLNAVLLLFLRYNTGGLLTLVLFIVDGISSALYLWGYKTDYRFTGLLQKIWIICATLVSIYAINMIIL